MGMVEQREPSERIPALGQQEAAIHQADFLNESAEDAYNAGNCCWKRSRAVPMVRRHPACHQEECVILAMRHFCQIALLGERYAPP
jgi:hypothetical protein